MTDASTTAPPSASLPRDLAICDDCLRETRDPNNRRYRYSFTTCARCGPRYSVLVSLPFDRARTTIAAFDLCPDCEQEFHDPQGRRFHAQTITCPYCGPLLWTSNGQQLLHIRSREALDAAADCLRHGRIVALRGLGGYQLLVDARSSSAIARLRQRKRRPTKPLAVLCRSLADARQLATMSAQEEAQLTSPANPIVVVRQRRPSMLSAQINPGMAEIGLLLPTMALHDLLLERVGFPLVCTSGNVDGEPLAYRVDDAEHRLQGVADLFMNHDREIHRPVEDSVVRVIAGRPVTLRAGRGIAPLPLPLPDPLRSATVGQTMLACGGHNQCAVAISSGPYALLAPFMGELDGLPAQERWDDQIRELSEVLTEGRDGRWPSSLACDHQSSCFPAQWAAMKTDLPVHVWHHHAHVVSGMVEHGWLDCEVLGIAWGGSRIGPDQTIWGGEFLRATATTFQRVAHLRPLVLPGGQAAIAEELRPLGVAVLSQLPELAAGDVAKVLAMTEREVHLVHQMMKPTLNPSTTSFDQLFDVMALLILNESQFEFGGSASMRLEGTCDLSAQGRYRFELQTQEPVQLDWRPVVRQIIADRRNGIPAGVMSTRFHRGLAQLVIDVAGHFPGLPVVLRGEIFQNRVLVELIAELWPADGRPLGLPGVIPPNDGGLAAGQLAVALASAAAELQTRTVEGIAFCHTNFGDVHAPSRQVLGAEVPIR